MDKFRALFLAKMKSRVVVFYPHPRMFIGFGERGERERDALI